MTSSGFEHIFLAELKKGKVIGLHNWLYFAEAEKRGDLDYKGWMRIIDLGVRSAFCTQKEQSWQKFEFQKAKVMKLRFDLKGLHKPVSSLLIGASPELEIALFTICFLSRPNRGCKVGYNNVPITVLTHSYNHNGKTYVGSAYVNA